MKIFLLAFLAVASFGKAFSQKSPIKFGAISMEEMQMTSYDKDTSAVAVILADYGESYVTVSTNYAALIFERHVRIKILKKEGLKWADAVIPLYYSGGNEEKITGLKAASYNLENGEIVETKMSRDGVFKEKFNSNFNLQKFTIPHVKEGSVIEYVYKKNSDFLDNFPNWQFQYPIPVKHSEYWAIIPEFFVFQKYMQGYLTATSYEVKNKNTGEFQSQGHHWVLKDAPAFREEPFMTSEADYVSKINFALSHLSFPGQPIQEIMGSWSKMNTSLLESEAFGKAINGSNFLKKTVEEITTGMSEPMQKVIAIHQYVTNTIEWNGTKDYAADPLKKVLELKKGSAGDINILLASMLEKAGITVNMVILSTRDHGFIRKEYPMRQQFNYVVCEVVVDGKPILLDATERYLPLHVLPERCLNAYGYRISAVNSGWVGLEPKAKARTVVTADLKLDPSGELRGSLVYVRDGYDAGRMRQNYLTKGQDEYLRDFKNNTSWQIENSEFKRVKEIDKAVEEKHELSIMDHAAVVGDVIYINPFVTEQLEANPFKLETREYPVDFGSPVEKTYICRIAIPEGYQIDEAPKSKIFVLPENAARYLFNVSQTGNQINVTSTMQINKNLFIQPEYPNLREFYNQVVAKQSEQIVLKKIN